MTPRAELLLLGCWLAAPVLAQAPHDAPVAYVARVVAACTPVATAQMRGCNVVHSYTCPGDYHLSITLHRGLPRDLFSFGVNGDIGGWVALDGYGRMQVTSVSDGFSLRALRETGTDTARHVAQIDVGYYAGPANETYEARLNGYQVEVDGELFLTGTGETTTVLPPQFGTWVNSYDIYLSRRDGLFLSSLRQVSAPQVNETFPSGLIRVFRPGVPGFLNDAALYDCN